MPKFFKCDKCECIESINLCHYWSNRIQKKQLLCSQCDPEIGKWHNRIEKKSAIGIPVNYDECYGYFLDPTSQEIINIIDTVKKITKFNRFDLGLGCGKCLSINWGQGVAKTLSGSTIYPYYCLDCGEVSCIYERKKITLQQLPKQIETNSIKKGYKMETCDVCGAEGTENHYWAPRSVFGNESSLWPVSNLCIKCHLKWHNMMEGYKRTGNKK